MDESAAEEAVRLGRVLEKGTGSRRLSEAQIASLVALANRDNPDSRMVAAYFLAFADDDASLRTLKALVDNSNGIVSGCARFSVRWRSLRAGKDQVLAADVGKAIHEITSPYARIMMVNRLAMDYEKESMPLIRGLLQDEADPLVRCDLLYYVVTHGTREDCRSVAALQWNEKVTPSESLSFLLGVITPRRSKDATDNSTGELLRRLHERIDSK